jgi:phosphoglycerate dehydrogenase-like enzyme
MRILVCHRDSGSQKLFGRLSAALPQFDWEESSPGAPIGPLEGVDAIIAVGPVRRDDMERGLFGFIQTVGTGYDNVDLAAATELGIWVSNMPASRTGNAESVAEHAILLMLALSRRLRDAEAAFADRRWAQPVGIALYRKRACLVGLGDVGAALAERLHAFGMQLVATRRDPAKGGPSFVRVVAAEELREAVTTADYVIVCARPSGDTDNLIDASILAACPATAILINIARGSLVDHDALLDALRSGHLRGAGLDVFWEEPADPAHPLFALPNVIATPHIAGVTDVNMSQTLLLVAENLNRYARGEVPEFLVNRPSHQRKTNANKHSVRGVGAAEQNQG